MDALPTPARRATASTLNPDHPTSPNSSMAASATRSSTPGSRGRPATGAVDELFIGTTFLGGPAIGAVRVLLNDSRQYSVLADVLDGSRSAIIAEAPRPGGRT